MRVAVVLLAMLSASSDLRADGLDVTRGYLGWGGEGGQVFRSKISLARNNNHNERAVMVIVDDLMPRGARRPIARLSIEYSGGRNASHTLLSSIRKKPFVYQLQSLYRRVPLSPRY